MTYTYTVYTHSTYSIVTLKYTRDCVSHLLLFDRHLLHLLFSHDLLLPNLVELLVFGQHFLFLSADLQQRLHLKHTHTHGISVKHRSSPAAHLNVCVCVCRNLGEESPPLPVPELQIRSAVPLDHSHGRQLLLPLSKRPEQQTPHHQYWPCLNHSSCV